jgi:HK97 gp10 family phage protein
MPVEFTASADVKINTSAMPEIKRLGAKAQDDVADLIVELSKANVPVDTGALRDSITKSKDGDSIMVKTDTGYGGFVEFGTVFQAAQPYMQPAAEQASQRINSGITIT